ncbi:MAG: YkgJ family cysteine cluster protein [Halarcobacter sp.]
MKDFILAEDKEFYFGDCNYCQAQCCSGIYGSIFSQILLEEFEKVYENFPILFIFGDLNYVKPVIILSDGFNYCPYIKDNRCTIYDKRPNVCRNYPLSPNLDNNIYIDTCCPQINPDDENKTLIIKNNKLSNEYQNDIFETYQERYLETHFEFDSLKKEDFKEILIIKSMKFYIYDGENNNKYLEYHKQSLVNLNNIFLEK